MCCSSSTSRTISCRAAAWRCRAATRWCRCSTVISPPSSAQGLPVYATRDWHPADHCSFHAQGGPWPAHCVAGTPGAEFAAASRCRPTPRSSPRRLRADRDAYSGFQGTDLDSRLRAAGVKRLFVGGLPPITACSTRCAMRVRRGYEVFLLVDAIRAVDVRPGRRRSGRGGDGQLSARSSSRWMALAA